MMAAHKKKKKERAPVASVISFSRYLVQYACRWGIFVMTTRSSFESKASAMMKSKRSSVHVLWDCNSAGDYVYSKTLVLLWVHARFI